MGQIGGMSSELAEVAKAIRRKAEICGDYRGENVGKGEQTKVAATRRGLQIVEQIDFYVDNVHWII